MKLISWNINGLRAALRKDLTQKILEQLEPDVLCLQEIKADLSIIESLRKKELKELLQDYLLFSHSAERKGYSGVATLVRKNIEVKKELKTLDLTEFDTEGRTLGLSLTNKKHSFLLFNIYFPNGTSSKQRVNYKLAFYKALFSYIQRLEELYQNKIIICGDYNTAHQAIDLHDPKSNQKTSGFLPEEREWLDYLEKQAYIDTFRYFYPQKKEAYTWWDQRTRARSRNKGWRIDYFFVKETLRASLKKAEILSEIEGSDHCPVLLELF